MELVKSGFLCLFSVDSPVSNNISVSEVVAHVYSRVADKSWAHTVAFFPWGLSNLDLSPRPTSTWEVGTQCIWVLSPAVAFGWSYQTVLRVIEGEGMNSKDRWTRVHAHTQAVWWPFQLATAKRSASLPPRSLQAARCFSECAWHRRVHSWVVNWSHLEMCE